MKIFLWLPGGEIIPGKPSGQEQNQAGKVNPAKLLVIVLDLKRERALKKICTLKAERADTGNAASPDRPACCGAEGLCLFQRQVLFCCGMATCPEEKRSESQLVRATLNTKKR